MQVYFYQKLIRVFAIVSSVDADRIGADAKGYLERFIKPVVDDAQFVSLIQQFDSDIHHFNQKLNFKRIASNAVRIMRLTQEMHEELNQKEKQLLLIRLYEFISEMDGDTLQAQEFADLIAEMMDLPELDKSKIRNFCFAAKGSDFEVLALNASSVFYYLKDVSILTNAHCFESNQIQPFAYSAILRFKDGKSYRYFDLLKRAGVDLRFLKIGIQNLHLKYKSREPLFQGLSLTFQGQGMLAVLGGSGSGKSSLLRCIAGVSKHGKGIVTSNQPELLFGFVPQEDNILSETTLTQQLYYILSKYNSNSEFTVSDILQSFGLLQYTDVKPADVNDSNLSGGERKRVALACALMSNPDVLLCDEPTSGLSSQDAENLVSQLRGFADEGKLICCTLHQPEMRLLRQFDNLLYLDEGGIPVFYGPPNEFFAYVSRVSGRQSAGAGLFVDERTELSSAESIIKREEKTEEGNVKRSYPPVFWRRNFIQNFQFDFPENPMKYKAKKARFYKAVAADLNSLFQRKAFFALSVMYAPVMAVLLALVSRFSGGDIYLPENNLHLPIFYMMSIVVAIFGGLVFSVSEISREQSVRKREFVVERGNNRYFLIKMQRLFALSVFHAVSFSVVGLGVLKLPYLFSSLVLNYFLLMLLSALVGLLISVLSRGKTWAYISIPLLIIPQLIFSGALIPWNKFPSIDYCCDAPVVSRLMPSALAFESLMTESVLSQSNFDFQSEQTHYISLLYLNYILPEFSRDEKDKSILYHSLPENLQNDSIDLSELRTVFAHNINTLAHFSNERELTVIWRFLQNYDEPVSYGLDQKNLCNKYQFYQTGTWRSDKSAYIKIFDVRMRHSTFSAMLMLFMITILVGLIIRKGKTWPW